jgi:hypothetical protein
MIRSQRLFVAGVNSQPFDGLASAVPVSGEADIRSLKQHAELLKELLAALKAPRRFRAERVPLRAKTRAG